MTDIPLVITYCNKYKKNGFENTRRFIETLKNNNWEHIILGEDEEWKGFITKIIAYKNYLKTINPEKIVVISDAHDVYCIRNSKYFITNFKSYNKDIIVSMELFAEGSNKYKFNREYFQVTWLEQYFNYYNIDYNNIDKKFVNSGLIAGYAKDLYLYCEYTISNNFVDDQKSLGAFMNAYPEKVYADLYNNILHTTTSFINGGICYKEQYNDSPNFNELIGQQSFFLHIPGLNISSGQKFLYNNIYEVIKLFNHNLIQNIYPNYKLLDFENCRKEYIELYNKD